MPDTAVTETVKKLRLAVGDTQQQFAHRMGLAISTVVRYESTRPPKGRALAGFVELATASNLPDLAKVLNDALLEEIGVSLATGHFALEHNQQVMGNTLGEILTNAGHLPELQKPVQTALKAIADGFRLIEKRRKAGTMIFPPHVESDEFAIALAALKKDLPDKQERAS
jgi:transcriptional regulator with XRE-family HTH domain